MPRVPSGHVRIYIGPKVPPGQLSYRPTWGFPDSLLHRWIRIFRIYLFIELLQYLVVHLFIETLPSMPRVPSGHVRIYILGPRFPQANFLTDPRGVSRLVVTPLDPHFSHILLYWIIAIFSCSFIYRNASKHALGAFGPRADIYWAQGSPQANYLTDPQGVSRLVVAPLDPHCSHIATGSIFQFFIRLSSEVCLPFLYNFTNLPELPFFFRG